ncbi:hypothetical protein BJ165DRAFT_1612892 [Panaeolus papilionaceus]|nr:hypothetical protein BJ165DRAFT_1612892 [Panaeolus papilionaceus]
MPAAPLPSSTHATPSSYHHVKRDASDYEPDEQWKADLWKQVESAFESMINDAKEDQAAQLRKAVVTPEERIRLEDEYKKAMATIKGLKKEQYEFELARERSARRWANGQPIPQAMSQLLRNEQASIMNTIKQTSSTGEGASQSPVGERRPDPHLPSEPPRREPSEPPQPPPPSSARRPERDKPSTPSTPVRRPPDSRNGISRDADDQHSSSLRRQALSTHERPSIPDNWTSNETVEEPEDFSSSFSAQRSAKPGQDRPPSLASSSSSIDRWEQSSLGRSGSVRSVGSDRHAPYSPYITTPETWSTDEGGSKAYALGRRSSVNSINSIRSTGSGSSSRAPVVETIPERADDGSEDSADMPPNPEDRERFHERKALEKAREYEHMPTSRRNSRPSPVDPSLRDDMPHGSGHRSASSSSTVMQYATGSSPYPKSLSAKSSFINDGYLGPERSKQPPPYLGDKSPYPPNSATRPPPSRSMYSSDEREYSGPYTPARPPIKSPNFTADYPPTHPSPVSHKTSFSHDDRRRVDQRDYDVRGPHWEEDWDYHNEREWDHRNREAYPDGRHPMHHPYPNGPPPSSARSTYPTPPVSASASRATLHSEYDHYDDREHIVPPSSAHRPGGYPYRGPDDYDYPRPESTRPMPRRQASYSSRREDPERPVGPPEDAYRHAYPGPPPRPAVTEEPTGVPAWTTWGNEAGARRVSEGRHDAPGYPRSPPAPEAISRRRSGQPPPSYHSSEDAPSYASREPIATDVESEVSSESAPLVATDEESDASKSEPKEGSDEEEEEEEEEGSEEDEEEESESEEDVKRNAKIRSSKVQVDSKKRSDGKVIPNGKDTKIKTSEAKRQKGVEAVREKEKGREKGREKDKERVKAREREREREKQKEIETVAKKEREKEKESKEKSKKKTKERDAAEKEEKKLTELKEEKRLAEQREEKLLAELREEKRLAGLKDEMRLAELKEQEERRREEMEQLESKKADVLKLEGRIAEREDAVKRKEEDVRKKEAELAKKLEEFMKKSKRREDDLTKREDEIQKKEDELSRKEENIVKRDTELTNRDRALKKKEQDAKKAADKRERELTRKADDLKCKEDELQQRVDDLDAREEQADEDGEERLQEAQRAVQAAKREQEQLRDELNRLQDKVRQRDAEVARRESELVRREEEVKKREASAQRKEEEAQRKETETQRKEMEAQRKTELDARRKETEAKRDADARRRQYEEDEAKKRAEDELRKREEVERSRREEQRRKEEERRRNGPRSADWFQEDIFDVDDPKLVEDQTKLMQQIEFDRRAQEIKERKFHNPDNLWGGPSISPGTSPSMARSTPQPGFPSAAATSAWNAATSSGRASAKPTMPSTASGWPGPSTPSPAPTGTWTNHGIPNKPRTGSVSSGAPFMPNTSTSSQIPQVSEAEWKGRHDRFYEEQKEKFRREQEQIEAERLLRAAGRPLSKDEMVRTYEQHERQWNQLSSPSDTPLTWRDFPWPIMKPAFSPDDLSAIFINAYIQSPHWPDKNKSFKDRIRDLIKRWHPDRFETKFLPKVLESEREKVQQGAGNVARNLNELLNKQNETASLFD